MSTAIQQHLKESVLKTALYHLLRNREKSPERTARNMEELLHRFQPAAGNGLFTYENLLLLINNYSMEDCLNMIIDQLI